MLSLRRFPAYRPSLLLNFKEKRTYVHFPVSSEEFFALFSASRQTRQNVRVKFTNKVKTGLKAAGSSLRSKIDKTMEQRPRLNELRISYKKTRDNVRRFRYEHSVSIKLPEGGEFNKDLGTGWFDSEGKPLATKTRFGRFVIPWGVNSTKKSFSEFLCWQWERATQTLSLTPPNPSDIPTTIPQIPPPGTYSGTGMATWLGHSTVVFTIPCSPSSAYNFITDPHFTPRASFIPNIGPLRYRSVFDDHPGLDTLGSKVDAVLISHDHFDHLDFGSLKILEKSKTKPIHYYVPAGTKSIMLSNLDVKPCDITELSWWETAKFPPSSKPCQAQPPARVTVTCAPAQHWCSRTPFDRNLRLWCSWSMTNFLNKSFFYAGDSGMPDEFPLFEMIGDRLGPFEISAIPIGAYKPRWFMQSQHIDPSEAVDVHRSIGSKLSLAVHWGTFPLADEAWREPLDELDVRCKELGISRENEFVTLAHGASIEAPEIEEHKEEEEDDFA